MTPTSRATQILARCRELALITDIPGQTTRLFLSPATRDAHTLLSYWFRQANLSTRTDDAGNLRAVRAATTLDAPTLVLFSHIDTVPNAGTFDGPLGVLLALAAIEELGSTPLPFHIELIAFSEEEGVRFGFPFLGSLAVTGQLTEAHLARTDASGLTASDALRAFNLDPTRIPETCPLPLNTVAALEVHIEQGPVLDAANVPLAVVEAIVGQSRLQLTFTGQANHAGTTPMPLRHDALVAAAQWIVEVERYASGYTQLVATVGKLDVSPGAGNVIPGLATATLDVRHPSDDSRHAAVAHLLTRAETAAQQHSVRVSAKVLSEQKAVPMNAALTQQLHLAANMAALELGIPAPLSLFSGAGHDAMILAPYLPTTMLFLRTPDGLSHHPDESVREADVEAALATALALLHNLSAPNLREP